MRALALHGAAAVLAASCWLVFATHAGPLPEAERKLSFVVDFRLYYRPNAEYLGARLADGALPLWNPQQGLGAPFLATLQPGALYPPNALHAWLPAQPALLLLTALHVAMAAGFAGALARRLGAGPIGGVSAGWLYGGSITFLSSVWTPPLCAASALAPAVLLAVDRVLSRPSAARATMLGVASALQLAAGWPLTAVMTAYVAALYAAAGLAAASNARLARAASLLCGATLGGALAAPLLLPAYELMQRSTRALGSVDRAQAVWIDTSHDLARFGSQLVESGASAGLPGVPALLLAALALWRAGPRLAQLAALAFAAVWFQLASFPSDFPVYDATRALPLLGDFRFPFHYRETATLLFAVLAGVGLGRIPAAGGGAIRVAVAALAVGLPLWNAGDRYVSMPRDAESKLRLDERLAQVAALPSPNRPQRVFWSNQQGKLGPPSNFHALYDLEPLTLARTAELATFLEAGVPTTVEDATWVPPGTPVPSHFEKRAPVPYYGRSRLPADSSRAALLDLLGVEWIVTERPAPWLALRYARVGRAGDLVIFRNPHALPRAYRVDAVEEEPDRLEDALARLVEPDFDGRSRALVAPLPSPRAAPAPGTPAANEVEILEYAPERVRLRTRGEQPGVVILTDAAYPGWEASVDGVSTPILRANTAFRGVSVDAGESEVVLQYRPRSFSAGLWIALAGLCAASGAGILERRRRAG